MARFTYKAINTEGKIIQGQIEAANESDLEVRMSNMGLDLIRFKTDIKKKPILSFKSTRIERRDIITFTYHLEQLLKAGVPIIEALQDLRDSVSQGLFRDIIATLIESIGSGKTFSEALIQYENIFGNVFINMVEVGERTGRLVQVLHDLTEMIKWQDELIAKAKNMAIYPAFVLTVVISVVAFLMAYLVPQLIPFIKLAGEEIPWYTTVLIMASDFAKNYWLLIILFPILIVAIVRMLVKYSADFRVLYDSFKLKVWLLGPINYKIKIARFSNYFAMMYMSGITVLDAINLSKNVMDNKVLENALINVHEQIAEGESISSSFANVGLFPALIVRMLRVGETTGGMAEALMNVSYFYNREVTESIDRIEPAIVPVITMFLGAIVFWVMLSVMGPIYDAVVTLSAF